MLNETVRELPFNMGQELEEMVNEGLLRHAGDGYAVVLPEDMTPHATAIYDSFPSQKKPVDMVQAVTEWGEKYDF